MALKVAQGPAAPTVIRWENLPYSFLQSARTEGSPPVDIARPQPVYTAPLISFLKGTVLASARLAAWQYVLLRGEHAFGAIHVALTAGGPTYAGVFEGKYVEWQMEALSLAESLPAMIQRDYELRILRIPSVVLNAVWLRSPGNDILIPVRHAPGPLEANGVYTEKQLTNALIPLATQRATVSDAETSV